MIDDLVGNAQLRPTRQWFAAAGIAHKARVSACAGYLGYPFRNIDVPYIKRVKQFGNLPIKLPIFRTDVPSSQHRGVTLSEALTNIGPLAFDLQPYPLTGAQGRLNLTQTFTLDPDELASITPLTGHVIVLHGAFNQGQYDRFLPAACGPVQAA